MHTERPWRVDVGRSTLRAGGDAVPDPADPQDKPDPRSAQPPGTQSTRPEKDARTPPPGDETRRADADEADADDSGKAPDAPEQEQEQDVAKQAPSKRGSD
jgi:hypothetical protein